MYNYELYYNQTEIFIYHFDNFNDSLRTRHQSSAYNVSVFIVHLFILLRRTVRHKYLSRS